ncbi:MAG: ribonuclease Y [Anaerolineae bacterium]|nr:ribonuclease Y [Anaerolineae bacterium]
MNGLWIILFGIVGLGVGIAVGYYLNRMVGQNQIAKAQAEAQRITADAESRAQNAVLAAKDEAVKIRDQAQAESSRWRANLHREEERLQKRREQLDERQETLDKREQRLGKRQSTIDRQRNEIQKLYDQRLQELEKVAQMTRGEAHQELLQVVEDDARQDMARIIREIEQEAKEEGDRRARKILTVAIQRIATDHVAEMTVSSIDLPSDEMKGRVIGRGGRNIRAFEQAAGVDVVVDDTPEAITISCFDPIRREIARRSMERLVVDGRIHPSRIEKILSDSRKEVEQVIRDEGERAVYEAGVSGLHPELVKLLGKLYFRTSYGQNQHAHAIESAKLAAMLAAELGANVEVSRLGGLLHDIGKAIDFEVEGTHSAIGADLARRYGVPDEVVHCLEAHHHEVEPQSVEAVIVEAADAISGARPGARRESLEQYIKRIHALEEIASSFDGVAETYAIQAGREIRIIVKPEEIDDLAAIQLSRDIATKIEEGMQYPGQIKVMVIRETRAVDYAK